MQTIANTVKSVYAKQIEKNYGLEFKINLNQEEPRYFGGASVDKGFFEIDIGAKLLTLPGMTPDAAALLFCHEVGHLLSGGPIKPTSTWASSEGQSDYFAAKECLRKVFVLLPNESSNNLASSPRLRITAAGQALINAIYIFMDVPQMPRPSILKREAPAAVGSATNYPTLQCRLDTFVAGADDQPAPPCW